MTEHAALELKFKHLRRDSDHTIHGSVLDSLGLGGNLPRAYRHTGPSMTPAGNHLNQLVLSRNGNTL